MFKAQSPYSPFFTAGLKAATKSAERSFLSLDAITITEVESSHSSSRSIPSPKPAPVSTLPDLPRRLGRKNTTNTTSTASTTYRRGRRSDALARLEGRPTRLPSSKRSNFMSLTDDEGDDADSSSDESDDAFGYRFAAQRSSITLVAADDDSIILPSSPLSAPIASNSSSPKSSKRGRRARAVSTSQWFPLKSFIDLRDREDDSGSVSVQWTTWRSFMEIGSVA